MLADIQQIVEQGDRSVTKTENNGLFLDADEIPANWGGRGGFEPPFPGWGSRRTSRCSTPAHHVEELTGLEWFSEARSILVRFSEQSCG